MRYRILCLILYVEIYLPRRISLVGSTEQIFTEQLGGTLKPWQRHLSRTSNTMSSFCLIFALFFINNHPVQREKARLVHFTTVKILALVAGSLSDYIITTTVAFLMEAVTPIILGLQMSWKYNVMELTLEKECGELRSSLNIPICQLSPSHWLYFPVGRFKICLERINFFSPPFFCFQCINHWGLFVYCSYIFFSQIRMCMNCIFVVWFVVHCWTMNWNAGSWAKLAHIGSWAI